MNIVVTGGKGFIGTYVVNDLVDTHDVTILDNGYRESQLPISKNIKIVDGNITDYNLVSNVVNGCDIVIHLAGISQVMTSIKHPSLTFEYNIRGTENIARSCCEAGVKLLFSSSREVYGTQEHRPVKTDTELKPDNPYAASKIAGEMLIKAYSKAYGLEYVIFRLSNVYGYGDSGRVLPIFIHNALHEKDLQIYGTNKIIDFVHVTDVAKAVSQMLTIDENVIVNIGSGIGQSLEDVAMLIKTYTGNKISINTLSPRIGEVDRYVADTTETFEIVGWRASIDFNDGLKKMIEDTRNSYSNQKKLMNFQDTYEREMLFPDQN